jgi:cholesterol transport system auxiliary component
MRRPAFLLASLLAFTTSCALLTKSDPVVPRYFSPEVPEPVVAPAGGTAAAGLSLRLGNVGGASYLKERIAFRDSDHEYGFYEDQRWTERPELYLQRALERSLFEEHGLKRDLSVSAFTLTVELIEFEEVKGVTPRVRVRLSYALHDERTVFRERSFAIERPLPAGTEQTRMERVAAALGDALREGVTRIADEVLADVSARVAPPR